MAAADDAARPDAPRPDAPRREVRPVFGAPEFPPHLLRRVDPAWPPPVVAQHLVLTQVRELLDRRGPVWDRRDPESLHKLRIATRRARTALRLFGELWPADVVKRHRRLLGRLADATGPARDLDVWLAALDRRQADAEGPRGAALRALASEARAARDAEQPVIQRALRAFEVQDGPGVLVAWFSRAPVDLWRWEPVRAPAGEALAARLDDLLGPRLDALCEQSRHLAHPECVEELHRLRLAGKQVRYAFELVRPCLAGDVEPAHKRLRRLQDRLGQVHDADLWTARLLERLRASLRRLRRGRKRLSARARAADPDLAKVARELAAELAEPALPGLALLVADVAQERGKAWRKLRELWTRMERDEVLQTLRDALAAPPPPAPAPTPLPESPQPPRAAAPAPSETASRFPLFSPPPAAAPAPAPRDPPAAPPPAP